MTAFVMAKKAALRRRRITVLEMRTRSSGWAAQRSWIGSGGSH
jgi:hypothetical protein